MSLSSSSQLVLDFPLNTVETFESFFAGDNAGVVEMLRRFSNGELGWFVFLNGPGGTGKSHLLNAVCVELESKGKTAACVPVGLVLDYGPELLEGYHGFDLVAIDDVHLLTGHGDWQEAIFHLHNRLQQDGGLLLASSGVPVRSLEIELADLESRICAADSVTLHEMEDEQKQEWLGWEFERRGLAFDPALVRFLLARFARSLPEIKALIDTLDRASLREKRALTIPFAREVLGLQ